MLRWSLHVLRVRVPCGLSTASFLLHAEFADCSRNVVHRLCDDLPQFRRRRGLRHRAALLDQIAVFRRRHDRDDVAVAADRRSAAACRSWRRCRASRTARSRCPSPSASARPARPLSRSGLVIARILSCLAWYCGSTAERRRDVQVHPAGDQVRHHLRAGAERNAVQRDAGKLLDLPRQDFLRRACAERGVADLARMRLGVLHELLRTCRPARRCDSASP